MNLIFNKLSEKLKNCKEIKTLQEREKFEDEIEKLLEETFKEYDAYSKKYLELNQEALYLTKHSMKSLMLEMNDIKEYDEENYPFYKYFFMTTYPSRDSFINELKKVIQYETKYPLLASYINDDIDQINILKNLPDFNEFINFMIDNYSYKISREEASNKLLKDALQSKSIQIIQVFMNLIFNKLSEKLKNCKEIKTLEEREKFEDEIEKFTRF